jgi:hypothetical protein
MILFDGGLSTSLSAIRMAWKPSVLMATWGVLVTAAITGIAAAWILRGPNKTHIFYLRGNVRSQHIVLLALLSAQLVALPLNDSRSVPLMKVGTK